jgi:hypothetical protein
LHFAAALIRAQWQRRRSLPRHIFRREPHLSRDYSHRIRDEYTLVTMLIHRGWRKKTRPSAETKNAQRNYLCFILHPLRALSTVGDVIFIYARAPCPSVNREQCICVDLMRVIVCTISPCGRKSFRALACGITLDNGQRAQSCPFLLPTTDGKFALVRPACALIATAANSDRKLKKKELQNLAHKL